SLLNMDYIQDRKLNVSGTLLLRQNKKYSTTHWYIITPPFSELR
ncbi:MAG: hypothetical protein ACI9UO_001786, partial [Nitrospinales bacterium]